MRTPEPLADRWAIVRGLPLFYRGADVAPAPAPTLVHLHGFGISGTYMLPTAARLASVARTFVPDMPGAGRSPRSEHVLDLDGMADTAIAFFDVMGIDRAVVLGNSLGCGVILEMATRYPDRVAGVVLCSPAGGPHNLPFARGLLQLATDGPREPLGMLPIALRDYTRFGTGRAWRLYRSLIGYPALARFHAVEAPILGVLGQRDPLLNRPVLPEVATLAHVSLVEIAGAAHALNFSHPDEVAAPVAAWLAGTPLAEAGLPPTVRVLADHPAGGLTARG